MGVPQVYKNNEQLCEMIRDYWRERMHNVEVKVVDLKVPQGGSHVTTHYRVIASNMVNGIPSGGPVIVKQPPANWQPPPSKEKSRAAA